MATIPVTSVPLDGFNGALGATVSGGDDFPVSEGDVLIFDNDHTAAITVNLVAVAASVPQVGGFPAALANKSFAIAPGAMLYLPLTGATLKGYQNATTGRVAVTYTGHNAALKVGLLRK
jgi:hypothetical protein